MRPGCAYTQASRSGEACRAVLVFSALRYGPSGLLTTGGGDPTSEPGICFYPPSQKARAVRPWMNGTGGPSEARRAKEGASADFAEEMKDTTGLHPWRLHGRGAIDSAPRSCCGLREKTPL